MLIILITAGTIGAIGLIVAVAVPVALKNKESTSIELARQWMKETPLIDGYVRMVLTISKYNIGPYSRKRTNFSPGLSLVFVTLINVN